VRDRAEKIPVIDPYCGISWLTTIDATLFLIIGLGNADLLLSEKGFYGMSFSLALFSAIAVQKNTRDVKLIDRMSGTVDSFQMKDDECSLFKRKFLKRTFYFLACKVS
jgi:hypothetical protein